MTQHTLYVIIQPIPTKFGGTLIDVIVSDFLAAKSG